MSGCTVRGTVKRQKSMYFGTAPYTVTIVYFIYVSSSVKSIVVRVQPLGETSTLSYNL